MLIPNLLGWKRLTWGSTKKAFFEYGVRNDQITCIGNGRHLYFIYRIFHEIDICLNWTRFQLNVDWFMCMCGCLHIATIFSPPFFITQCLISMSIEHTHNIIDKTRCIQAITCLFFMNKTPHKRKLNLMVNNCSHWKLIKYIVTH